jgi:hypothetical protein
MSITNKVAEIYNRFGEEISLECENLDDENEQIYPIYLTKSQDRQIVELKRIFLYFFLLHNFCFTNITIPVY